MKETNPKFVKMNKNELKAIAEDKSKSEDDRMMSLIRLANIWGNTIDVEQLRFIYSIVSNLNNQLNLFDTTQLSRSYANRLQLIDSIVIDRRKAFPWYRLDVLVRMGCYINAFILIHLDSTMITTSPNSIDQFIIEYDQLIIEKMRFVLSNNYVISISTKDNADLHMENLYHFTQLIDTYRIKIDTADLQLLKERFDQARTYYPNHCYIKEIVSNLPAINK